MKQHKSILQIFAILYLCFLTGCRVTKSTLINESQTEQPASSYSSPIFQSIISSPLAKPSPTAFISTPVPTPADSDTSIPTPIPAITQTPTPTNTPQPTATPRSPNEEADRILKTDVWEYGIQNAVPVAVRIMDYLMRYPDSPRREELLATLFRANPIFFNDWFILTELDEFVRQPFNQATGMPDSFAEELQNQELIQIYVTDLDGNGTDDFIIATKHVFQWSIYWLYGKPGEYQLTALPTGDEEILAYANVRMIEDLNNDGVSELVYVVNTSGASDAFEEVYILSWKNEQFKNMIIGDNTTQNGGWLFTDIDEDGVYELVKRNGGPGSLGFCCALPFEVDYQLLGDEYIPVQQRPGNSLGEGEKPDWQLAKMMQHTHHYTKAIEYLDLYLTDLQDDTYRYEVIPYVYFQLGMAHLLMNEPVAAQDTWQSLVQNFPEHPLTLDVLEMQPMLQTRDDIWRACAWLRQNKREWPLSEDKQHIFQREAYYNSWEDLCDPMFLLNQWEWTQTTPITTQLAARALNWHVLSEIFDLNDDGIPDPIGEIELGDSRQVWIFLTQSDGTYKPLYAEQPYPPEAIHIWNKWGYEGYWYLDDFDVTLMDNDQDGNPEIFYTRSDADYTLQTEWIGHRFEKVGGEGIKLDNFIAPNFGDDKSFPNILKTLFYDQNFETALDLLEDYNPAVDSSIHQPSHFYWAEAGSHYLRGLAYSYLGETELAHQSLTTVIQNYPDTSWVDLARERLGQ
jgi:hypothetical protein